MTLKQRREKEDRPGFLDSENQEDQRSLWNVGAACQAAARSLVPYQRNATIGTKKNRLIKAKISQAY